MSLTDIEIKVQVDGNLCNPECICFKGYPALIECGIFGFLSTINGKSQRVAYRHPECISSERGK